MTVYGKDKRGLVEELRKLRTRLDGLERRNAELMEIQETLQESVDQLKTIFDNTLVGLYRTTPDGRILMANPTLLKMLGYSSFEQLARRNLEEGGYEPQYLRSDFKECIEGEGKIVGLESTWKKSDGTTLYVRESAQAVRDESGNVLYYQGTVEDITEHKQTKMALQSSEQMFKALIANMSEGVDIVDENLRCTFANPAGEEIFGVGAGGLVGRTLHEFVSDEGRCRIEEQLSKRREGIGSSYDLEIIRPDGQKRQLIVSGAPRFSEDGKYLGALAIFFDVTKRKQAEENLRKAHDELEMRVQERTAELQQTNEALQERELSLNLALQVANLGHWDWHIPTDKVVCSDEVYRMFDVQPEQFQFTYERFLEFVHPSDRESVRDKIQCLLLEDKILDMEFRIFTAKEQERILHVRAASFKDRTGETVRMIGTIRDVTEQRQADKQIRERARIIDSTTDSVIKTNRDGIVTMWNRGAERIFGYTSEEMVGQPIDTLYSEQEQGRLAEIVETLLRGEEIATTEVTCVHKDGSPVELALSVLPFKDDSGNVTDFVGISKDISDHKKAQKALHESENRYRTVIENAGEGIVVAQNGMLRFVNSKLVIVTGCSKEELVSRPFIEFVHPDDRQMVAEIHAARLRGDKVPSVYEFRIIDKNGRARWLENNGVLIEWNDEPASLNFLRDITARKKAEEALREHEEMIRSLVETSRDWIWSIDINSVHTYCNPAVEQILGYSPDELIGKRSFDLIHDDDRIRVEADLPTWIDEKRGWSNLMLRWRHKDGTYRYLESNAVPILSSENELVGFRGVDRDVTDRKRAEEALKISEERFRTTIESLPFDFFIIGEDGRYVFQNSVVKENWGDVIGRRPEDVANSEETRALWKENNKRAFSGETIEGEVSFSLKGEKKHFYNIISPILGEDRIQGILGMNIDITERKQAEKALKETTGLLETIFAHTHILVACLDSQFNFVRVNRAYAEADEREPSFFPGKNHFDLYPNAENEVIFREVIETGVPYFAHAKPFEYAEHPERGITYWDWSLVPIKQQDGVVSGLVLTLANVTEQKRAEQAMRESEGRFRKVFEEGPIGMVLTSRDLKFFSANPAFCKMLGYTAEEMSGKTFLDVTHPAHRQADRENVEKMWRGEIQHYKTEKRYLAKNGGVRWGSLSTSLIRGQHGEPRYALAMVEDITERKRAEKALRESEEKFRSLAEQSPNMIFINKDGRIVYINKKCEEVMGYKKEELCSPDFDFRVLIAPESLDLINDVFVRHLRGEDVQTYDYTIITKDGRRIEVINASKLIQYEGQTAILGIVTDITERKSSEQALRESEERLKILFESAPDAIYLIDSEGRFVDGNRAALELVGFARDEVIGRSLAELNLLSAEQLLQAEVNIRKVIAGRLSGPNEYILKRKDGSFVSIEVRTFPVKIAGKMLTLGIARDITEHKQTEKKLLEHQAELKSLASQLSLTEERERHRLATDLHDQISQSLVISKIKLDQLCKSSISSEFNKPLEDISKCLGQIIDDTRALTFDLSYPILYELGFEAAVAEWLTDQVQKKHGIETEFVDDGRKKPLDDDIRVLLFRNVRELLINVVKHARAHKVIVAIHRIQKHIEITVEDDGVGFDPVKVTSTAAKRAEFGLFSIRERLEQLGGKIEINSNPGRGSRITMIAPLKYKNSTHRTRK